jgi:hypothetical protein
MTGMGGSGVSSVTGVGGMTGMGSTGSVGAGGTAGSGGTGTGGTGATSTFEPCPTDGSPCTILPLGDSITYGDKSSDQAGYRSHLYRLIVAADQNVTFTGSRSEGPAQVSGVPFPRMHEGHPGWTIDPGYNTNPAFDGGISQLIPTPALDGNPHIILLCIGTNDLFARDTEDMATRLDALLDDIVANAPNSLIALAQITPLGDPNAALTAYNEQIPGIVATRAAAGEHIISVDMSTLPASGLHSDGTHPNDSGYAYMADVWYAAIGDLLPK